MFKLFIILLLLFNCSIASAEKFLVEATGEHLMSRNEKLDEAEELALHDALRNCCQQVGVHITAYTTVINNMVSEDRIDVFSSNVVKIKKKTYDRKIEHNEIIVTATVQAIVDTADLEKWQPPDREMQQKLEEDKRRLHEENRVLREENETLSAENERLSIGHTGLNSAERTVVKQTLEKSTAMLRQHNWFGTLDYLTQQINAGVISSEIYYQRACCLFQANRLQEAVTDIKHAIDIQPIAKYYKVLGDCYYSLNDNHKALINYNIAIKLKPKYGAAFCNRGCTYWVLGNKDRAINDLKTAASLGGGANMANFILQQINGDKVNIIKANARQKPIIDFVEIF